jgi:hypothetical protein
MAFDAFITYLLCLNVSQKITATKVGYDIFSICSMFSEKYAFEICLNEKKISRQMKLFDR